MPWIEILGFLAGVLTTFSAFPQLRYSYTTKDVASIDLTFMGMLISGLATWGIYGIIIESPSIVCFNFLGAALWVPILAMKVRDVRKKRAAGGGK